MENGLKIPPYTPLGAYAEEHGDEICHFVKKYFRLKNEPEITDSDGFSDCVEVGFKMEWDCDGETVICDDYVELYGSTCGFKVSGSFSVDKTDWGNWARWCLKHCGHWAYREEDDG